MMCKQIWINFIQFYYDNQYFTVEGKLVEITFNTRIKKLANISMNKYINPISCKCGLLRDCMDEFVNIYASAKHGLFIPGSSKEE